MGKGKKGNIILFYPNYKEMGAYHWFPFPYMYIGSFLEKDGFNPIVIDARIDADWRNTLKKVLDGALCLGVTTTTGTDINYAIEASKISKEKNPRFPVIWGGPHVSVLPEQTVAEDYIDAVVSGQGEKVMTDMANRICDNKDFAGIHGVTYKENGRILQNSGFDKMPFNCNLFPAFNLIDVEKYRSPNNVVSMFTMRGCPFNCTFCTTKDQGYSERTLEQVKEEILFLVDKLKFRNIFIQDGTFFMNKERVMKIANWLIDLGIKWKAKARANSLLDYSDEDFRILKKSGLVSVFFGIESGSERVLRNIRKDTKPLEAEKSAEICKKHDLEYYISFMFAMPHETVDDLKETISHIRKLKKINPDAVVQNCVYLPLAGTLMYEEACKEGYQPPTKLEGWARGISSRFEERTDITWIPKDVLKEYIKIYNDEFGRYKHVHEKEKEGKYKSIFQKKKNS